MHKNRYTWLLITTMMLAGLAYFFGISPDQPSKPSPPLIASPNTKRQLYNNLGPSSPPQNGASVQDLSDQKWSKISECANHPSETCVQTLLVNLDPLEETDIIVAILHVLRKHPDPQTFERMQTLAASSDPLVLRGVIMGMGSIGSLLDEPRKYQAVQTLTTLFFRFQHGEDTFSKGHRYTILQALSQIPCRDTTAFLRKITPLYRDDLPILYLIVACLGKISDPVSQELLLTIKGTMGPIPEDPEARLIWQDLDHKITTLLTD